MFYIAETCYFQGEVCLKCSFSMRSFPGTSTQLYIKITLSFMFKTSRLIWLWRRWGYKERVAVKRQKLQAPTPQAPIRNRQTRKVANAKGLNRNTNLT